jgi:antirestriction protein ArdC
MANAYDIIADRIITALDAGQIPWRKPWTVTAGMQPQNAIDHRPYRGINAFILGMSGYADPRWITYKRAIGKGGQVRKGEKGTPVVFWKWLESEDKDTGETKRFPLLKYFTVFNVEQIYGLSLEALEIPAEFDPVAVADAIIQDMPKRPRISHYGGNEASYSPRFDRIALPDKASFHDADGYYATVFHELGHSTGHGKRLGRRGVENIGYFGSPVYSREELVAEFTSAFLCSESGIHNIETNSVAYIQNWSKVIKRDKKMIVVAASQGQKAADYILGRSGKYEPVMQGSTTDRS